MNTSILSYIDNLTNSFPNMADLVAVLNNQTHDTYGLQAKNTNVVKYVGNKINEDSIDEFMFYIDSSYLNEAFNEIKLVRDFINLKTSNLLFGSISIKD